MKDDEWLDVLLHLRERQTPGVILTLIEDRGSVPRGAGTKMVVTGEETWLTIGGGNLEFQCIAIGREMLMGGAARPREEKFALGARAGQCCGGATRVLFEPWGRPQPAVYVFGAGHVGRALVTLLATLPCRVFWVDEREAQLRDAPAGVRCLHADDPCDVARRAPDNSLFVVMTHSHPQDLALAEALLRREGVRYLGVIGSQTKRQRFDYLLEGRGIPAAKLAAMRCPIGLPDVKGKLPAEIAIAVAGEIIAVYQGGE